MSETHSVDVAIRCISIICLGAAHGTNTNEPMSQLAGLMLPHPFFSREGVSLFIVSLCCLQERVCKF